MDVENFFNSHVEQNIIWSESPYLNELNKNVRIELSILY
jgi:hypothetical protein